MKTLRLVRDAVRIYNGPFKQKVNGQVIERPTGLKDMNKTRVAVMQAAKAKGYDEETIEGFRRLSNTDLKTMITSGLVSK